jgi:hypothetical protein
MERAVINDQGILALPPLLDLRCHDLDTTKDTDRALESLARLPRLEELGLESTEVTDAGLDALHAVRSLRFVSVAYTAVSPEGAASLSKAIPGVKVST